jgi:hypothetical protein
MLSHETLTSNSLLNESQIEKNQASFSLKNNALRPEPTGLFSFLPSPFYLPRLIKVMANTKYPYFYSNFNSTLRISTILILSPTKKSWNR